MKALIVLENHFYLDSNNQVWCDRIVDYNYLSRYLKVFDNIVVTGRTTLIKKITGKKLLVSGNNVSFIPMPDFKGIKGLIFNLKKIKKIIKKEIKNCDCAIYRAPTHLSLFTYKEIKKQNKPLALEFMMAADKMIEGKTIIKRLLNKFINKQAKKMCLASDGVSYVTEYTLQKQYPCKKILDKNNPLFFTESYSSIDLDDSQYYLPDVNLKYNSNNKTFKIIHTGYMDSYRKGQDTLIKAIKKVTDNGYNNIEVTLIGDGKIRKTLEELTMKLNIENKIKFLGLIKDKNEILEKLRESDLFVFPTHSEGLPRSIIEAMSQGLPCISSPVDGIVELLDSEYLIEYDSTSEYANKIIYLINNSKEMKKQAKRNYEVSKRYERKILERKRTNFYKKLKQLSKR